MALDNHIPCTVSSSFLFRVSLGSVGLELTRGELRALKSILRKRQRFETIIKPDAHFDLERGRIVHDLKTFDRNAISFLNRKENQILSKLNAIVD